MTATETRTDERIFVENRIQFLRKGRAFTDASALREGLGFRHTDLTDLFYDIEEHFETRLGSFLKLKTVGDLIADAERSRSEKGPRP